MSSTFRTVTTIIVVVLLTIAATILFLGPSAQASVSPTDLLVGPSYEVADFRSCEMPDGTTAIEWHFGGADRSRRNQLTPKFDGRGRRILRIVTDSTTLLPAGHMRLRRVVEADPTLEGFTYGNYRWEGLIVEFNGQVEAQKVIGPCGPARN